MSSPAVHSTDHKSFHCVLEIEVFCSNILTLLTRWYVGNHCSSVN